MCRVLWTARGQILQLSRKLFNFEAYSSGDNPLVFHTMSFLAKKIPLLTALLLLSAASSLYAQGPWRDARTGTASLRLEGGASWSFGASVSNTAERQPNLTQPFTGVGILYNLLSWIRLGADYSYTQMVREQLLSSLQTPSGSGLSPVSTGGTIYRDFKTRFHGASFTGEFNLLDLGGHGGSSRLALWAGTGIGCLFTQGYSWDVSISNEVSSSDWTQTVHFGAHNEPHRYTILCVPATLSLEYSILPQLALTLGGSCRFLPDESGLAPKSQAFATAGLLFNLTGKGIHIEQ